MNILQEVSILFFFGGVVFCFYSSSSVPLWYLLERELQATNQIASRLRTVTIK